VLVPELTKRFFAHLNAESPGDGVHLEALQDDQLNNQNPFVCLARFVGIPLAAVLNAKVSCSACRAQCWEDAMERPRSNFASGEFQRCGKG
jgi:hypothetical protein